MSMILSLVAAASSLEPAAKAAARIAPKIDPAAPASILPALGSTLFALVLVVGLILAMAWLLRRMPGHGLATGGGLRLVTSLNVGMKERVMVIDVGGEQLLVGVAPGEINFLYRLPQPLPMAEPAPNFPALLMKRLRPQEKSP